MGAEDRRRRETEAPDGYAKPAHDRMSVGMVVTTVISFLLPCLLVVLPHLSRAPVQGGTGVRGAYVPLLPLGPAAPPAGTAPPLVNSPASAFTAMPQPTRQIPQYPVVASAEEAAQVCAGVRREDHLGQPVVPPVQAVIMVQFASLDPWHLPPPVPC